MIIKLSPTEPPSLDDLDRFDRLHATCVGELADMAAGPLCRWSVTEPAHVWLDIGSARAVVVNARGDAGGDGFDAMISYAASKGWLDDDGSHVRAHVERA